jgi:acyl transferase domain-containing protein/acyl carrier protein
MKTDQNKNTGLEIAIVGMACRFPGAGNWRTFWDNLVNGYESIQFLSNDELLQRGVSEDVFQQQHFIKARNPLEGRDNFDSPFFEYRLEEAKLISPATRLFHECLWEALEDAGYDPFQGNGQIGLFAGSNENTTWKNYVKAIGTDVDFLTLDYLSNEDYLTTLLSYKLNLKGPSVFVNTACSTALVAVNMACKSLLFGETRIAIAGGASVLTEEQIGYRYQEGMIASSDGRCRTFDKSASGTIRGEGAGVVVLKRLIDAVNDGDTIHAVIKGSAINNDGNRKVGFTAPSVDGQVDCIKRAQRFAKVAPETISYVEAHGTGTTLGDPIEVQALNIAFNNDTKHSCALGSVKTNIGHLDVAAGMAGLIKTALSLKNKILPPSLHYKIPNPNIDFDSGPFYVNDKLTEWFSTDGTPLRAAVSSFGIGGTNAHVIVEEPPVQSAGSEGRKTKILVLSARTEASLIRYSKALKEFLLKEPAIHLDNLSYTLKIGRRPFSYRSSFVYADQPELLAKLDAVAQRAVSRTQEKKRPVIFLFPGQGTQYATMGRELYIHEPVFKKEMDRGLATAAQLLGEDLKAIWFGDDVMLEKINETRYTQPLLFLFEHALARLLMSFGITPDLMAGHSLGEYVAACISGIMSVEQAMKIIVKRASLMDTLPQGTMISAATSPQQANEFVNEIKTISIAAINSDEQVVFSGDQESVAVLIQSFKDNNIPHLKLRTSHAFHSQMMNRIAGDFKATLDEVVLNGMHIPFVSNVSGNFAGAECSSSSYWVRQMCEPVNFSASLKKLLATHPDGLFVEVGPGNTLTKLVSQHNDSANAVAINTVGGQTNHGDANEHLLNALAQLWSQGVDINWKDFYNDEKRTRISLPTYSFEPIQHGPDFSLVKEESSTRSNGKNKNNNSWLYYPSWRKSFLQPVEPEIDDRKFLYVSRGGELSGFVKATLLENTSVFVEVLQGSEYRKLSQNKYILNPHTHSDYGALLADLKNDGISFTDIIYEWSDDTSGVEVAEKNGRRFSAFFSLIYLMQALSRTAVISEKRLTIITNSLHKVIGVEGGPVVQSLLLGLSKIIQQEYAVNSLCVDVDDVSYETARKIVSEIYSNTSTVESLVALRYEQRWVMDFQKNMQPVVKNENVVKHRGVYVITGGMGDAGFILAKHLMKTYHAKVALIGRSEFDHSATSSLQYKRWSELAGLGDDVKYVTSDVSDLESLTAAITSIENTWGTIHGVIHAAGITDSGYFQLIDDVNAEMALQMFAPKISGIENIHSLFKDRNPDFVWITSSIATVLGGLSYAAYAAANSYMEYFVGSRAHELSNWRCIGLSALAFTDEDLKATPDGLLPAEFIDIFHMTLGIKTQVIWQTKNDLQSHIRKHISGLPGSTSIDDSPLKTVRPFFSTEFQEAETDTERKLKEMFETFFGMDRIGVNDDFFELGGDSLKGMMLLKRIKSEFNVDMPLMDLLMMPTIRLIAVKIDEMLWFKTDAKMNNETVI